jgi:hypothetical protein
MFRMTPVAHFDNSSEDFQREDRRIKAEQSKASAVAGCQRVEPSNILKPFSGDIR